MNVPMVYGILQPYILMPANLELEPWELYYVLSHEASHYFHHDLLIKSSINIITIIYWWNPMVYLFRKQAGLLLEMQVDDRVVNGEERAKLEYLNCLIRVKEQTIENSDKAKIPGSLSLTFLRGGKTELERRFGMMESIGKRRKRWVNILLTAAIMSIYFLSYQFIFEIYYNPYKMNEDRNEKSVEFFPQAADIYAIETAEGSYEIYMISPLFEDMIIETVDNLENNFEVETIYYLEKGRFK